MDRDPGRPAAWHVGWEAGHTPRGQRSPDQRLAHRAARSRACVSLSQSLRSGRQLRGGEQLRGHGRVCWEPVWKLRPGCWTRTANMGAVYRQQPMASSSPTSHAGPRTHSLTQKPCAPRDALRQGFPGGRAVSAWSRSPPLGRRHGETQSCTEDTPRSAASPGTERAGRAETRGCVTQGERSRWTKRNVTLWGPLWQSHDGLGVS